MTHKEFHKKAKPLNLEWALIQEYLDQKSGGTSLEALEQYAFELEESDRLQGEWDSQQPEARIAIGERHAVSRFLR